MARDVDGEGFAFVPRTVVHQPAAFGVAPGLLDPAPEYSTESARYRAAMIQHLMCVAIKAAVVKRTGRSPAHFVQNSNERGLGADRVRRVFRGATMAQFTDLAFWVGHFPEVTEDVDEYIKGWST